MARKNNNQKRSRNGEKPVHLEFIHSAANDVAIAGSFNGWRPESAQLVGKGKWAKDLSLAPGTYEYLFVVDGSWLPDPLAKVAVANPFGGVNSLLTVAE